MADTYTPKTGEYVRLLVDLPDGLPAATLFKVVAVNSEKKSPGKLVALECEERWPMLHDCDRACGPMRGWWSRPENLERVRL